MDPASLALQVVIKSLDVFLAVWAAMTPEQKQTAIAHTLQNEANFIAFWQRVAALLNLPKG